MMKTNNGTTYGYVRVSTRDQNEARQLVAMRSSVYRMIVCIWISSPGRTSIEPSTRN